MLPRSSAFLLRLQCFQSLALFGLGSSLCLVLSHCAVWLGLVSMIDGILLVALTDMLALIVSPLVRMGKPCANGMLHVRLIGTPFEVAHMVVEFVAIDMVDARQAVVVRCECFDDQPMHLAAIRFVVHPEHHRIVTSALDGLRHDAPNHTVVSFH